MRPFSRGLSVLPAALIVSLVGFSPAWAEEFDEQLSIDASSLRLANLIGEIRVEGHRGNNFEIEVHVRGEDASRDRIRIETREGRNAEVAILFPIEEETRYVYPELGSGSTTTFKIGEDGGDSWWKELLGQMKGKKVEVRGSGKGLAAWADVVIRVPRGKELDVRHGVGQTTAEGVEGDLGLDSKSGRIDVSDHTGGLSADTGSGSVNVSGAKGTINVDTGSGAVEVTGVEGELRVDTGSGSVNVTRCRGDVVNVDTGSGRVYLDGVECGSLFVDTGSGGIEARGVKTGHASLDTGSGSVEFVLTQLDGNVDIDTGSGSITLELPARVSATVEASTGNGGIHIEVDDYRMIKKSKYEKKFEIGGGDSRIRLETGSGSIRIRG